MGLRDRNKGKGRKPNWEISYSVTEEMRVKFGLPRRLVREPGSDDNKGCRSKDTADAKLKRRRREVREGTWKPEAQSTAGLLFETYAERVHAARVESGVKTAPDEIARLRTYVFPRLGKRPLELIKRDEVKEAFAEIKKAISETTRKELAPRTVNRVYEATRIVFNAALDEEIITLSPCRLKVAKDELPKKKDADPRWRAGALFDRIEFTTLVSDDRIALQHRVYYGIALFTGSRLGEVSGRKFRDRFKDRKPLGMLHMPTQYDDEETKTDTVREVPIHPVLAELLDEWEASGFELVYGRPPTPEDFIVPPKAAGYHGKVTGVKANASVKQPTAWGWLRDDLKMLGLRHRRMHDTRRTLVTLAQEDGAVQHWLHWITHGPSSEIMGMYSSPAWSVLCAQISCLKIRRGGLYGIALAAPPSPTEPFEGIRITCQRCSRVLMHLDSLAAGPLRLTCRGCGATAHVDLGEVPQPPLALPAPEEDETWTGVDWDRGDTEIAAELGVDRSLVRRRREAFGHPAARAEQESTPAAAVDWDALDWSKTDKEIEQETGVLAGTVRRHRLALGHQPSAGKRGFRPRSEEKESPT